MSLAISFDVYYEIVYSPICRNNIEGAIDSACWVIYFFYILEYMHRLLIFVFAFVTYTRSGQEFGLSLLSIS